MRRKSGKQRRRQPSSTRRRSSKAAESNGPERIELDRSELEAILKHAKTALSEAECAKLHAAMETLIYLTQELEKNRVSVQRLKKLLFGATMEKTRKVMEKLLDQADKENNSGDDGAKDKAPETQKKAKGHGRNGAEAYTGADKVCERALKKAILHRKNSYFYKTRNGARVGDLFMSLIHTCELNGGNPFDYLTELQKHADGLSSYPDHWMPWNYRQMLQETDVTHPQACHTSQTF